MTANLQNMMVMRDLQVAFDIAKRAELGWFDVEFTMYGCGYLKDGKRYFRISAEAEKIYDFFAQGANNDLLPSDLYTVTYSCPVPVGMRDYVARDVKKALAKQIKELFSTDFFVFLREIAEKATDESAWPLLLEQWELVEGCFDRKKINAFGDLVNYAYSCRKIKTYQHEQMMRRIADELSNMQEDIEVKDIFEKTFYGIAFLQNDKLCYFNNACKEHVYRKKGQLENEGVFVTPLYEATYWYNYDLRLPQVHEKFLADIKTDVNMEYYNLLKQISRHNDCVTKEKFNEYQHYVADKFGAAALETLNKYGYLWGIL